MVHYSRWIRSLVCTEKLISHGKVTIVFTCWLFVMTLLEICTTLQDGPDLFTITEFGRIVICFYILTDSAFIASKHVMPAFKGMAGSNTNTAINRQAFNDLLAKPRVKLEHCIGLLKGRFPFLKNIRIDIKSWASLRNILRYVGALSFYISPDWNTLWRELDQWAWQRWQFITDEPGGIAKWQCTDISKNIP